MINENRPKIGLALGSGGVKGLAHVGVIKVLEENNIPVDYIAGSSIGALIGAFYATNKDVEKLKSIALHSNWKTGLSIFDPTWRGGLIKGKKLEKLIKTWLNEINFNNLKIPLTIIATDLITGKEIRFNSGDIIKAVRASLSAPVVFQPVKYNGYLLSDGGLSNPLPDNVVRQMGADIVISVNLDNGYFNNGLSGESMPLRKVSIRSLNIMRYHLAQNCLKTTDVIIEPRISEIGLVGWNKFFDEKEASAVIEAGEKAMKERLNRLQKLI